VEETLRQWFDSDENPSDFYQLLGKPRLDPARDELLDAVRSAYRALHSIENHAASERLPRARLLQKMIVEAEQVIGAEAQWRSYNESLAARLRTQYVAGAGRDPSTWRMENLRLWLARTQNVHPSRVDELVASFVAPAGPADAERTVASSVLETVKEAPSKSGVGGVAGAGQAVARAAGTPGVRPARPVERHREGGGRSDAAIPVAAPVAPPAPRRGVRPSLPDSGGRDVRRPPEVARSSEARGLSTSPSSRSSNPALPTVAPPTAERRPAVTSAAARASLAARAWNNLLWTVATALVTALVFGGVGVAIVLSRH
jgi:hypothetical protein